MRKFMIILTLLLLSIASTDLSAQYKLKKGVVGGGKPAVGGSSKVNGTLSQDVVGTSSGGNYKITSGFWGSQTSNLVISPPSIVMDSINSQSIYAATCFFRITSTGFIPVTRKGVCWSTTGTPTVSDFRNENIGTYGPASYSMIVNNLSPSAVYHIRAFAENASGITYSNEVTINTIPTLPEWGLIALGSLLVGMSVWFAVRKVV